MFCRVTVRKTGEGRDFSFLFETEFPSIAALHNALVRDGRVYGMRYDTTPDDRGRRIMRNKSEFSLSGSGAVDLMPATDPLYTPRGALIFSPEAQQ